MPRPQARWMIEEVSVLCVWFCSGLSPALHLCSAHPLHFQLQPVVACAVKVCQSLCMAYRMQFYYVARIKIIVAVCLFNRLYAQLHWIYGLSSGSNGAGHKAYCIFFFFSRYMQTAPHHVHPSVPPYLCSFQMYLGPVPDISHVKM